MLTKIIDRCRFCKTHRYFKSVRPADAFPVLLQYYNHHIVIISCASHSKYGPYSENMTAEAGRKESRLFSRFLLSATVVAGDRYGSIAALLWRGCAYPGNSPSFKNALRRCTPITLRSKPSVHPRTQCNQATKASCSRRPASLRPLLTDRQAASLPGMTVRLLTCEAVSAFGLSTRQKGPKMVGDATTVQLEIPRGRA